MTVKSNGRRTNASRRGFFCFDALYYFAGIKPKHRNAPAPANRPAENAVIVDAQSNHFGFAGKFFERSRRLDGGRQKQGNHNPRQEHAN